MLEKRLLAYIVFFLFAFCVHLIGLNHIGRTWDEQYKVDSGYVAWERLLANDFSLDSWNEWTEHPIVGKYVYGFFLSPGLVYMGGPEGQAQLSFTQILTLQNGNYLRTELRDKTYAAAYDYTFPRVISALFNAAAATFTVLIAELLLGTTWWAFLAGGLLLVMPRFVFLGQLVTFESLSVFLFCLIILLFNKLLQNPKKLKFYWIVGILCGLFFWTRYNNIIFLPFLAGWLAIHYLFFKQKKIFTWKLLLIPLLAFLLGILIWPYLWHEFPKHLFESFGFHEKRFVGLSGYYWRYLFATTPLPILFGSIIGLFFCFKKRTYWHSMLLWWILCTVILYSIFAIHLGGTRYIVILYPAIAILTAYGYFKLLKGKLIYLLIPILLWLVFEQGRVFPYYLDYYNQFVGGATGAIKRGYDFSWWGEGQREAGLWINDHAEEGSTVGLMVTPRYVFPRIRLGLHLKGFVDEKSDVNYMVISQSEMGKLSKQFLQSHTTVYEATVDNEPLVTVMKKKSN